MALAVPPSWNMVMPFAGWSPRRVAGVIAVCLAMLAGCRSASQTDLVEREMRQQEDQIYALQDYLADYQQLLCEYRSENEVLKRQLVTGQFRDGQPSRRRPDSPPRSPTTPIPPGEPPPDDESTPPPSDIPPLQFEESDIPPLEPTSANDVDAASHVVAECEFEHDASLEPAVGHVTTVAFEEPLPAGGAEHAVEQILVRGEVWPGDATTGPRVLVDVDPLTACGQPAEFQGHLSLMVLDVDSSGVEQNLARWDFAPDEWQLMVVEGTNGTALELPLQLPADVPTDRPVELWVRLVPDGGDKVLASAAIDLGRGGQFASAVSTRRAAVDHAGVQTAERVVRGSPDPARIGGVVGRPRHNRGEPRTASRGSGPVHQSDWQTARPGEMPPPTASPAKNVSAWRTATQPIPAVAEPPIHPTPPPRAVAMRSEPPMQPEKPRLPTWSPDRPGTAHETSRDEAAGKPAVDPVPLPPRPAWSPNR